MNNRRGAQALRLSRAFHTRRRSIFQRPIFIAVLAVIPGGCASPGEPIERKPPVPLAVSDLAGTQSGNSVVLAFTLPQDTTDRRPLAQPPAIEIYRNFESATGTAAPPVPAVPAHPELLVTIPSAMVDRYATQGRIRYVDSLNASDFTQHPDSIAVYVVRTRASAKKESANSNPASLRLYPAPTPIEDAKAEITRSGIQITWTPPRDTPVGPVPPIVAYRIYRATTPQGTVSSAPAASEPNIPTPNEERVQLRSIFTKIGETESPDYLDVQTQTGNEYTYSVRSVVQYSAEALESADSNLVSITARDVFPPRAPAGLVVVVVPAGPEGPARLDLSWAIGSETDVAGYNVYRSEQAGTLGTRLNAELLATPVFRDMTAVPGQRYFYSVTAVSRSGAESPASGAVSGSVPAEGNPAP